MSNTHNPDLDKDQAQSADFDSLSKIWETTSSQVSCSEEEKKDAELVIQGKDRIELPKALTADSDDSVDIRKLIDGMTLPQKMKLALFGSKQVRGLLIFDTNRLIQECVLKNPRMQVIEIEEFVRNTSLPDNVFRGIARNRDWMKSYAVKKGLVCNPKTPLDLSMRWLGFLNARDLKEISRSKNCPQVLANEARKRVSP